MGSRRGSTAIGCIRRQCTAGECKERFLTRLSAVVTQHNLGCVDMPSITLEVHDPQILAIPSGDSDHEQKTGCDFMGLA
ncbi:hypothetical protein D3C71_914190 [compost metagenome]